MTTEKLTELAKLGKSIGAKLGASILSTGVCDIDIHKIGYAVVFDVSGADDFGDMFLYHDEECIALFKYE